jgi:hypothetical protein
MHSDPILREVHRMKDKLAREVGYGVEKLFDRLREVAKRHPERMVKPAPKPVTRDNPRTANRKTAK